MNCWIFVVTNRKVEGETHKAEDIFGRRMADKFWGLGERTPNRKSLIKGDEVVFYVGSGKSVFAARAKLSDSSFQLTAEQKEEFSHGKALYRPDYGVFLEDIEIFEPPIHIQDVLDKLSFIENKRSWGNYLQGGIKGIEEPDFRQIAEGRKFLQSPEQADKDRTPESNSEFALEMHLEEFLEKNWARINFGSTLEWYKTDERDGRQFPAGTWSIDFLCVDKPTGDFVVVELKKGRTSDAVVGQTLRYMGWVAENLAKPGQNVRGIIITKETDDALKYSVRQAPNISVATYKVNFQLSMLAPHKTVKSGA